MNYIFAGKKLLSTITSYFKENNSDVVKKIDESLKMSKEEMDKNMKNIEDEMGSLRRGKFEQKSDKPKKIWEIRRQIHDCIEELDQSSKAIKMFEEKKDEGWLKTAWDAVCSLFGGSDKKGADVLQEHDNRIRNQLRKLNSYMESLEAETVQLVRSFKYLDAKMDTIKVLLSRKKTDKKIEKQLEECDDILNAARGILDEMELSKMFSNQKALIEAFGEVLCPEMAESLKGSLKDSPSLASVKECLRKKENELSKCRTEFDTLDDTDSPNLASSDDTSSQTVKKASAASCVCAIL